VVCQHKYRDEKDRRREIQQQQLSCIQKDSHRGSLPAAGGRPTVIRRFDPESYAILTREVFRIAVSGEAAHGSEIMPPTSSGERL
jgi:hypothetical protein